MPFNFDAAKVFLIEECPLPVAYTGRLYGEPEQDSTGRVMVLGHEMNYFAAYATNGRFIVDIETSYALLPQAKEAADEFTRFACEVAS